MVSKYLTVKDVMNKLKEFPEDMRISVQGTMETERSLKARRVSRDTTGIVSGSTIGFTPVIKKIPEIPGFSDFTERLIITQGGWEWCLNASVPKTPEEHPKDFGHPLPNPTNEENK